MRPRPALSQLAGRTIALAILLHLVLLLVAAVGPGLHHWAHEDADHPGHECGITAVAMATWLDATPAVHVTAPRWESAGETLLPVADRVATVRHSPGILEHAPPRAA